MNYIITNIKSGQTFGTFKGKTPAEALAAMHRDAGYNVLAEGDKLVWPDDETAEICGGLEAWDVEETN